MIRLGVNIDHVATIRNARGEEHPDPYNAAINSLKYGADLITIHLREDRRHINDLDLKKISNNKKIPLNLEMACNIKMLKIALKTKPNFVCIVPEKRKEITTEGGINLKKNKKNLKKILKELNKNHIRTSLFINPNIKDVKISKELNKIKKATDYAIKLGIEVHAGHGMDYKTSKVLSKVKGIKEFNIGHFIIGESIFHGLKKTILKLKKIIN